MLKIMHKSWIFLGLIFAAGLAVAQPTPIGPPVGPPANPDTGSNVPRIDDKKFLKETALDGMTEIELGKLAAQKSSNPQVKQFAQQMIEDYTASGRAILRIARDEQVEIPKTIDSRHQARVDRLAKLSGRPFDRAYIQDENRQHHQDLKEFTKASQGGNDPNLKTFATETLPSLEDHLTTLKSLEKATK